jgi:quinoprotein glucose dehydrogenase
MRSEGIYTPPSRQGTVVIPGNAGGSNWGGVAVDEGRQLVVANAQELPFAISLIPRAEAPAKPRERKVEVAPMKGTPYVLRREPLLSPLGIPCNPPPWGTLAAVDLARGEIAWQVPLGTLRDVTPIPIPIRVGVPNLGGPLVTGGGLVFIGAAFDHYLRAFDLGTGEELWRARLPFGGQATPMTYRARAGGRQYVVIAATGYGRLDPSAAGDAIVAFALPER